MAKKSLKIDNVPYEWDKDTITAEELRQLGGIPDNVQIWLKNPGAPDTLVEAGQVIDLTKPGIEKFSTQEASSGAGGK